MHPTVPDIANNLQMPKSNPDIRFFEVKNIKGKCILTRHPLGKGNGSRDRIQIFNIKKSL
jgi:hypothetical protein